MKDIKEIYGGAATYKSTSTNTLLNFLELPMESKNWLITKFTLTRTALLMLLP